MGQSDLHTCCRSLLAEGKQRHGMSVGIVSQVVGERYEVVAVDSDTGIPQTGDVYPLGATYCLAVIDGRHSMAITEIDGEPGMRLHPLYEDIPCEAYLSSPIIVGDRVWGTLNYTSFEIRERPFSPRDVEFNEGQARQIASAIEQAGI